MTTFTMNLNEKYFDYVASGTKRIELRLFDEKRSKIKVGDEIEFNNGGCEIVDAKVVELIREKDFETLIEKFPIEILADKKETKENLLEDLEKFYSKEKQEKFGVLGIKFELEGEK